jgi:hypothetical protein
MHIRITHSAQTNLPLSVNGKASIILPTDKSVDLSTFDGYEPAEIREALDLSNAEYEIVDAPGASAEGEDGRGVESSPSPVIDEEEPPVVEEEEPAPITDERRDELLKLLDSNIDDITPQLADLTAAERAVVLAAENDGKTRKTLIAAIEALNA